MITACVSISVCFRLDLHTVARPVLHRCETGALLHVLVILGAAVPEFIHSPFFYPCCAISFAGIVALIYYCICCNGGASIACWQVVGIAAVEDNVHPPCRPIRAMGCGVQPPAGG